MATPLEFSRQYAQAAAQAADALNVDPRILLGQWGLETGWGRSVIPGTNNLGNIKDFRGTGVAATDNMTGSRDKYRQFDSPGSFAAHFADLIRRKYPDAVGAQDATQFATALKQGGYAEDPNYINKVAAATRTVSKPGIMESIANFMIPTAHAGELAPWENDPIVESAPWEDDPIVGEQPQRAPTTDERITASIPGRIMKGIKDPLDAGAQALIHALPQPAVDAVNSAAQFINDIPGIGPIARAAGIAPEPEGGIDADVQGSEDYFQNARKLTGNQGIDFGRLAGNMIGTAPLFAAPEIAPTFAGRIAQGALSGAGFGLSQPALSEDYGREKLSQAAIGGALGVAATPLASTLSRVISPRASTNQNVKLLQGEGVELTPGQQLGGPALWAEDKAMSMPILGDTIRSARTRGQEQLNKAAYNRVLEPIGQKTDKVGREAIDDISNKIGRAYDDVLGRVTFQPDAQFAQEIGRLRAMAAELPQKEAAQFERILHTEVIEPLTKGQAVDGLTFKRIESQLGAKARNYLSATDGYQRDLGNAILEVQRSLRENLARLNPGHAQQLQNVNRAFSQLARLQDAAGKIGAEGGVFTPAQLSSAVRAGDKSARKNRYARGDAVMQDLSDAARDRMMSQIPNSGTADRLLLNVGAIGSGLVNPAIPGGLAAASIPYLPGVNKIVAGMLTSRPEAARRIASQVDAIPPGLLSLMGNY